MRIRKEPTGKYQEPGKTLGQLFATKRIKLVKQIKIFKYVV